MEIPIGEIASLGVGGIFGLVVFLMYRIDRKRSEERLRQDRMYMEDRMNRIIDRDQDSRGALTTALTELTTLLIRLNGRIK